MSRFIDFHNSSHLKHDIQNRISPDIELRFKDGLNHIKGDKNEGLDFSEVVKLAMAYFFCEIFKDPIKDQYYTLDYVKGFLDADNKTMYTEIHNVPKEFIRLENHSLFPACWLIVQTAWFVNSEHFGRHQLIEYLNHYITAGEQLPIESYQFDKEYLEKKYNDYDKGIFKGNTAGFVNGWFNSILFLVCCELQLPLNGFKVATKGDREYNPLTKCLRLLRPLMPFKIIENDIKSAFVSFIDIETGARLRDFVYERLMKSKNISRGEAKRLFNTVCNSGLKDYITTEKLTDFFYSCGYSEMQTKRLIQMVTDKEWTFYEAMTEYERQAIDIFNRRNALTGTARVHDAVIYIDQGLRPANLQAFSTVLFGHTEMNQPVLNSAYSYGNKWLTYAHVSSVPSGLICVHRKEFGKPATLGTANGFVFYDGKFSYLSASFNLNDWAKFKEGTAKLFFDECMLMIVVIEHLTNRCLTSFELETIVKHIRENSNHIFDKRYLFSLLSVPVPMPFEPKTSNYGFTEHLTFKKNIDFLNAMNEAKRIVTTSRNYREIFDLLYERILNEDYSFLTESYLLKGRPFNNVLPRLIVQRWNVLTSGFVRQSKSVTDKINPLYNTPIKSVKINGNAERQRKFKQRKAEQIKAELINNRPKAKQLLFIIGNYAGEVPAVDFQADEVLIKELKAEIMADYYKSKTDEQISFDEFFPLGAEYQLPGLNPEQTEFETDMINSIFNQYDEIEAIQRGDRFYKEWEYFHQNKTQSVEVPKCRVTGVDISMQKAGSVLLSHSGLKHYKETKPTLFNRIKNKYLSKQWAKADEQTQIKEIAHNIRNFSTVYKQKQTRVYIGTQSNLLSQFFS